MSPAQGYGRPINIYLGWDKDEMVAYHVAAHSIIRRATQPVNIIPVARHHMELAFTRPRTEKESTDFSISRFMVPWLSGYDGLSVFMDSDILCLGNVVHLLRDIAARDRESVWCVQHDYQPTETVKFLGNIQTVYPRKNWSSVMVFNNKRCTALTPEYVNTATGLDLHRFNWLEQEAVIGSLDPCWNVLVGELVPDCAPKILHFTQGTPCHPGYENCPYSELWWEEYDDMVAMRGVRTHHMAGG